MLKKLGRRLTFVNFLVTGAILLTMTIVSLHITEQTLVSQQENDLRTYVSALLPTLYESGFALPMEQFGLRLHLPEKYALYIESPQPRQTVIVANALSPEIFDRLADEIDATITVEEAMGKSNVAFFSVSDQEPEGAPTLSIRSSEMIAYAFQDYRLQTLDDINYRIAVCSLHTNGQQSTMLVLQDRTEELQSRDDLRLLFFACVAGGLFLVVLASLYLSSRSIRPVEASIRSQQEFVAAASHELRTPVAAIRANAEVLEDAELGTFSPFLQSIHEESVRMSRLVDDLMSLARADAGQLSVETVLVDIAEVAGEALRLIRPMAEQQSLTLSADVSSALIQGDPNRLRQVLLALLDNAIRYTPPGGTLRISACREGRSGVLRVEDTGIGIADEYKARVFDRFYCIDTVRTNTSGGAGLGLSVAQQFVQLMKGRIEIADGREGGCMFILTFPLVGN